ncbi:universal stress protein [Streptomyces sp. NPDC096136]|uniref:universal stress protein n=1 Tax=Streptomyces sp. NPDC096136 TaxID=3366076 RepID=UPI0038285D16
MESTSRTPDTGPVVVGVDGSDAARTAAQWAAAEAVRRDRPLHVVHGADTEGRALHLSAQAVERVRADARAAGRELLDVTERALRAEHPGLDVTTGFSTADAVDSLRRAAGADGTIVVGHRGQGGFDSLMLGSVGLDVASAATTPVVVVRGTGGDEGTGTVLVAVRDVRDLPHARYAAREAELRKASLRLLHVWNVLHSVGQVVSMLDGVDEIAGAHAAALKAVGDAVGDEFPELEVSADAEKGVSVAGALVEASRAADLLVMGGRRDPGTHRIARGLGRVSHRVLHHAHCPVLLLPRPAGDPGNAS